MRPTNKLRTGRKERKEKRTNRQRKWGCKGRRREKEKRRAPKCPQITQPKSKARGKRREKARRNVLGVNKKGEKGEFECLENFDAHIPHERNRRTKRNKGKWVRGVESGGVRFKK
ncbi:hypothetical protein BOTBODRAFT_232264 [Botryobasidium botryosum FD-172 SS1]|uniref:Uncharacterized protein n=1 Tax=Botryobasidium botryosum (strain FD-172 SS1) TaxID=930990 RepID=A0A067M4Y7_BOTB1|nr:hypothetical protein BOTBODRAFT_232264 [Botryobasidium botryosum FD-172 SS1]